MSSFIAAMMQLGIALGMGMVGVTDPTSVVEPEVRTTAAQWQCQPERWVHGPVVEHGQVHGTMVDDCMVTGGIEGGLLTLEPYLEGEVAKSKEVHGGPIAETYDGVPSRRWDVTNEMPNGDSPIRVREDIHLASDRSARLIYDHISKEISASGLASNLKQFNVGMDVRAMPRNIGTYIVRISASVVIDKPWYVPDRVILDRGEKVARGQFVRIRDRMMPDLAGHL